MTVELAPTTAYGAKQCPQRVQLDVLLPCDPLPDSLFLRKLVETGHEYEDETFAALFEGVDGVARIEGDDPDAREQATVAAMVDGAAVVAGGRLPVDDEAHRVGEPDLLVRHLDGYLAVDVKSHKVLEAARRPGQGTARVSTAEHPFYEAAAVDPEYDRRRHHLVKDLLQLAHYRRLLESAGLAPATANVGGILGSEGVIVWYDLDEPLLEAPEHVVGAPAGPLSAMARYDLEFAHRIEVYLAAESHFVDERAPLLAEPIRCDDCDMCGWREWCGEQLEDAADLSLISGIGVARRRLYKAHGVRDLRDLAALDWATAELLRGKVDLDDLCARSEGLEGSTALADVIPTRKKQLEHLAATGLVTVGDLARIDARVRALVDAGAGGLSVQIELARARTGPSPAYRRRGVEAIEVPRADVEVDVDMENTADGCYLWGALLSDRRPRAPGAHYVPFATWDPDLASGQLSAFARFWSWLSDTRAAAHADGATFRAYCYARGAEEGQMKPLADALGCRDEVDAFVASDEWVDLLEVVRRSLVTGRRMGLKDVAPLAGFSWRAEDSGGTLAMVNYDLAVGDDDPGIRDAARRWILDYNEDDVRATAAVRAWLDGPGRQLPSIADAP